MPLAFSTPTKSQTYLDALDQNFPNLNSLVAINMSNADPVKLKQARAQFVTALEPQSDIFDLIFAPGTGSYYENHGILYHSLEDVKSRIAYAKSLQPLFTAIAAAPTAQSLATLVNEVSASIELGRDPQGLDALFSESAQAVQALMMGVERPVDWTTIAGLNVEPLPTSVLVFAVPKSGKNAQAIAAVNDTLALMPPDDGTTTLVDKPVQNQIKSTPSVTPSNIWPAIAMAIIFVIFVLVATLGQFTLASMIALPVLLVLMSVSGPFRYFVQGQVVQCWPAFVAVFLIATQIAARLSFLLVEALGMTRSKESAVMLAAQKQGRGLGWLTGAAILVWSGWFALNDMAFTIPILIIIGAIALSYLAALTVIPALVAILPTAATWRASDWLLRLHEALFNNRLWRILRNLLAISAIAVACAGFWLSPKILLQVKAPTQVESAVNILAQSPSEAEAIVKTLNSIPQAISVRWLGAFLPQQMDEKQLALKDLKDQFPRITPLIPQAPDLLREHIATLQASLQAIANSSATRKELRDAASIFRQSLELLAATSSNTEVMALENRIFGSFNVLVDRADTMAGLDKPNLQTLDPRLRTLFLSEKNLFRLEVTPVAGLSNSELARVLAAQGFHVAHPVLVVDEAIQTEQRSIYIILATTLMFALIALILATKELIGFLSSTFTLAAFVGCIAAALFKFQINPTPEMLLAFVAVSAFMISVLGMAFLKRQFPNSVSSNAFYAVEAWLPVVLLSAITCPFLLLKLQEETLKLGAFTAATALALLVAALLLRPLTMILRGS